MNHREVLGVSNSASSSEIKDAFRKRAKESHPDLSDSPEAAEAFARIKEAHDALIAEAELLEDVASVQQTTDAAIKSTVLAGAKAYTKPEPVTDPATVARIQKLDELARQSVKRALFGLGKPAESAEVRAHRKKLKRNNQRLEGRY